MGRYATKMGGGGREVLRASPWAIMASFSTWVAEQQLGRVAQSDDASVRTGTPGAHAETGRFRLTHLQLVTDFRGASSLFMHTYVQRPRWPPQLTLEAVDDKGATSPCFASQRLAIDKCTQSGLAPCKKDRPELHAEPSPTLQGCRVPNGRAVGSWAGAPKIRSTSYGVTELDADSTASTGILPTFGTY
jgi:hypothetical protein